jgi:hypothetical protein
LLQKEEWTNPVDGKIYRFSNKYLAMIAAYKYGNYSFADLARGYLEKYNVDVYVWDPCGE